jgi:hypothetical protein
MKYDKFAELIEADEIHNNVSNCIRYLKEAASDEIDVKIINLYKKNYNGDYILKDVISLLSKLEKYI